MELTRSVYQIVTTEKELSEFDLLCRLRETGEREFSRVTSGDTLGLFRQHFLLFHVLYRVRDRLVAEGEGELTIGPLRIALEPLGPGRPGLCPADPQRACYLELEQLSTVTAEDVAALLSGFWKRFSARSEHDAAIAVFDLEPPVTLAAIKLRYRQLAMRHHPDRGGDAERLKSVNRAMDVLMRCYG